MTNRTQREQLAKYLEEGHAHVSLREATSDIPAKHRCTPVEELPYTLWDLVEHIRIAQRDIVEFSTGPGHVSPTFPDGYWPEDTDHVSDADWNESLERIERDKQRMIELVQDTDRSLTEPFPWGDGQSLLREAQLVIDHRSYHTGQIVAVRRLLDLWPAGDSSFSM